MGSGESAILTYHSLDTSGSVLSTDPHAFQRQMEWLAESGIPVVPLSAAPRTPGSVALTFDDGFRSFLSDALPLLEKYNLPATLFVVSGYCGRSNRWPGQSPRVPEFELLDWTELREVSARGISLGAHTVNHPRLPALSDAEAEAELGDSKAAIEDRVGTSVDAFAYPYGVSSPAIRGLVRRRFRVGCGTRLQLAGDSDPYDLPRVDVYYLRRQFWFERLMTGGGRRYLRARRLLRDARACLFPSL